MPIPPIPPKLMPMAAVLVTRRLPSLVLDKLRAAGTVDLYAGDEPISRGELRGRLADKDALVCLLTDRIDGSILEAAPVDAAIIGIIDQMDVNANL